MVDPIHREAFFGWIKLNSDGSVRNGGRQASCGGLLRNELGHFLDEFSCNLGSCTIMQAKLLGILHGLLLAKSRSVDHLFIEADSKSAIHFLDGDCDIRHPCATIIYDIKKLLNWFLKVIWKHAYREANCCADILADHVHYVHLGVHTFNQVPSFLSVAFFVDLAGTHFDRVT